jgi:hypothetical protein
LPARPLRGITTVRTPSSCREFLDRGLAVAAVGGHGAHTPPGPSDDPGGGGGELRGVDGVAAFHGGRARRRRRCRGPGPCSRTPPAGPIASAHRCTNCGGGGSSAIAPSSARTAASAASTARALGSVSAAACTRAARSGRKPRPQFRALLDTVRAGKVDVVVAWALDRLARTARDRLALVEACRDAGVIIALVRGSDMDPTTPAGRLVVQGVRVARKRVWRLMRAAGLQGRHPKPWKRTTIAGQRPIDAADLIGRDFTAEQPNTRRGSAVRSNRAGQHRGAPAHRPRRAAVDPPGPRCPAPAHGLRHDLPVRPNGGRALPPTAVPGRSTRRCTPRRTASRRRASTTSWPTSRWSPGTSAAHRSTPSRHAWRSGGRAHAGAVGRARPGVHRPVPTRPAPPPATRPGAPQRDRIAPGHRGQRFLCGHDVRRLRRPGHLVRRRRRCGSGWGVVDSVWYCMPESVRFYRGTDTPRTSR